MIYALHTQDLTKTHLSSLQQKYSSFIRIIHEAEEKRDARRNGESDILYRDNNEKIRTKWGLQTIESNIKVDRTRFPISAKIQAKPAYLTDIRNAEI